MSGRQRGVGVDLASTEVRVVEVSGFDRDGVALVSRVGTAPLPEGAVVAGEVRDTSAAASALTQALRRAGVPKHGFVVGVGGVRTHVGRERVAAGLRPSEYEQALRYLGRELSPKLQLDQARLAARWVARHDVGPDEVEDELVVAAAPEESVAAVLETCRLAGAAPAAVDVSAVGLLRALVYAPRRARTVGAIVDFGASQTQVLIYEGRHARSLTVIPSGGDEITRALVGAANIPWAEAELRKRHLRISGVGAADGPADASVGYGDDAVPAAQVEFTSRSDVDEAVANTAEMIVEQVVNAIDHDASRFGTRAQGVSLSGAGAQLSGMKELVAQRAGVFALLADPRARGHGKPKRLGPLAEDPRASEALLPLATAVGLATPPEDD